MKRFDYNNVYLNMKHGEENLSEPTVAKPVRQPAVRETVEPVSQGVSTPETKAIDEANLEKTKAQDNVDTVLYQDSRPKKPVIKIAKPASQTDQVVVSGDSLSESVVDENDDISGQDVNSVEPVSHADSYSSDSVVDDFKNEFDNDSDDDAVLVRPDDVVAPVRQSLDSQSRMAEDVYEESQPAEQPVVQQSQSVHHALPKYSAGDNVVSKIVDKNSISLSQLKIYSDLADRAQAMFPAAGGAADAVNAYLYVKLGYPVDIGVSAQLKSVIDSYVGDGTSEYYIESDMNEILDKIVNLQSNDKAVMHKLELLEVLISYFLCEYNGYVVNKSGPVSPSELSLCNSHVQELMSNLESIGASELANFKMRKVSRTSSSGRRMK